MCMCESDIGGRWACARLTDARRHIHLAVDVWCGVWCRVWQSYLFLRLLSLGASCYPAFDDAVTACEKLCGVVGVGARLLVRTSKKVRLCGVGMG